MIRTCALWNKLAIALTVVVVTVALLSAPASAQAENPAPPTTPVKLVFIHHSTGENWLADEHGGLGRLLAENNYFVSDTNYGWGPDAIGDRTDILNWTEWFRGLDSSRYLAALFAESEQHAAYSRLFSDPGGENSIVLFKSCFPNSDIAGRPDDPAAPADSLTVANAKWIYNDLLRYFSTRPDKLFIVITAPPLQDPTHAANARAFNHWLVFDWLTENNYTYPNVAVFDFNLVLTHPDNHHRYQNGRVEYTVANDRQTLYYDSDGDDHPNPQGSQKAAQEFAPLLNIFYHRWQASAAAKTPVQAAPPTPVPTQARLAQEPAAAPAQPADPAGSALIDNFEGAGMGDSPPWQAFWDESTQTSLTCTPAAADGRGGQALQIDFNIQPNTWGTCARFFDQPRDWRSASGLRFAVHAAAPALVFDVNIYSGPSEDRATYLFSIETTPEMASGWIWFEVPWELLTRVAWEADAGTPLSPTQVSGLAFGLNTYPDTPNTGQIWIDDLQLLGLPVSEAAPLATTSTPAEESHPPVVQPAAAETAAPPPAAPAPEEPRQTGGRNCFAPLALAILAAVAMRLRRPVG